jgi:F-type H+-transporting ATPase subunit b
MDALANIGVDWKLLLAQVVNFGILLWVLKRYAYQPMLKMMDERTAKIERGLLDAEAAQVKLREMEEKEKAVLLEARAEAKKILAETDDAAKKRDALKVAETEERVKKLLADAEVKINDDRSKMLAEAKSELAETVLLAVERILREKVTK